MTTLNHYHQESRWLFGAERFLFDFRTGKNKNPFCRVSGSPGGFVPAIMLALVLFAPLPAEAQQFYWTGNTSTDWTTGSNWQGGAAPSSNATSPPPRACRLLPEAHEDAAARLKNGACEDDAPPVITIRPHFKFPLIKPTPICKNYQKSPNPTLLESRLLSPWLQCPVCFKLKTLEKISS
jgi:hypothetical protein